MYTIGDKVREKIPYSGTNVHPEMEVIQVYKLVEAKPDDIVEPHEYLYRIESHWGSYLAGSDSLELVTDDREGSDSPSGNVEQETSSGPIKSLHPEGGGVNQGGEKEV